MFIRPDVFDLVMSEILSDYMLLSFDPLDDIETIEVFLLGA